MEEIQEISNILNNISNRIDISERSILSSIDISTNEKEILDNITTLIPNMKKVSVRPMYKTPEEAIEASKNENKMNFDIIQENMLQYIFERLK